MEREISIGSQLYINGDETPAEIKGLVAKMNDAGLRLIRLFMLWDLLEKRENEWDFTLFDACFDAAAEYGMGVIPTLMPVSPPGYMKITRASQDIADIDDPVYWAKGLFYTETVVLHYKDHPALHSWILWNEPSRRITLSDTKIGDYTAFLQKKYGTIDNYNSRHYRKYESYDELKSTYLNVCPSLAFAPYTETTDMLDYTAENLCNKLTDIGNVIRRHDKTHPIHINPHDIARASYGDGQSFYKEGKTVDFLGCSAHPSWHSTDFRKERIPLSIAYFAAVMRAASPDRNRFWVTELQGGTNIFSGNSYLCPDGKDIALWLAEGFSEGAESTVFWCFNTRNSGFEGGEWGLLNQLNGTSDRLAAVTEFAEMIRKNQSLFNSVRPVTPKVYILYSDNSIRLQSVETVRNSPDGIRNKNNGIFAVIGAFTAASDLGFSPAIIYEEDFAENGLPEYSTLILTDTYCLAPETLSAVKKFAQAGGTVIADGLIAMKTADGRIDKTALSSAAEIFGAEVEDIKATADAIPVTDGVNTANGEFLNIVLTPTTAKATGSLTVNTLGEYSETRNPDGNITANTPNECGETRTPDDNITVNTVGKDSNTRTPNGNITANTPDECGETRIPDGNIIINRIGKGRAIRIPTVLFRRYRRTEEKEILTLLSALMPAPDKVHLLNPAPAIQLKTLVAPDGQHLIYVLNSSSQPFTAEIIGIKEMRELTTPPHKTEFSLNSTAPDGVLSVTLSPRDFAVFTAKQE